MGSNALKEKKKSFFFFSDHATKQLRLRSLMMRADVLKLLDKGLYIPVGKDKDRVHAVIFSIKDNKPFVIVYDENNLEIITFLYIEYNNKFVIFNEPVEEIKNKTLIHKKTLLKKVNQPIKTKKDFICEWLIVNKNKKQLKPNSDYEVISVSEIKNSSATESMFLFSFNSSEYFNDVEQIDLEYFVKKVEHMVNSFCIDPVNILSISFKNTSDNSIIKWAASKKFVKQVFS